MGKMKRTTLLLVALVFTVVATFAGCGSNSSKSTEETAKASAGASSQTDSTELKPYVIDWYLLPPSGPQADQELINAEINKIIQPKINATLKVHAYDWGTYETKMQAAVATGEKIDLCFTASWMSGFSYSQNAAKGTFLDITDLLPKYAPNAAKVLANGWLDAARINGKVYAMACNKEKGVGLGIIANKKMMADLNLDISNINSLEDFEPYLKAVKEKVPGSIPFVMTKDLHLQLIDRTLANDYGIKPIIMNADGSGFVSVLDDPNFIMHCRTMKKYYDAGYIRKDVYTLKDDKPDLKTGKFGLAIASLKPYVEAQIASEIGTEVISHQIGKPLARTGDMLGSMMAVGSTSEDPQRVLMFYDMFYSDPVMVNLFDYGIEGTHYVKVDDKSIEYAPATEGGKKSTYKPDNQWQIGNQFLTYIMKGEKADKWDLFNKFNEDCELAPALGFTPNFDDVKTQIAAINNLKDQYYSPLTCGVVDIDKILPEYKEKLKQAGIDKVLESLNKQYADWKAVTGK